MNDQLSDVTYWLTLQIARSEPPVDLTRLYQGSVELDYLYQVLTSKARHHWWTNYDVDLSPMIINNAFFRAISALNKRNKEYENSRRYDRTDWVRELLHR
ncbi:hypothetical protein CBF23_009400 [Marinomonas agarivorans]|nr:hypothetical protein CBF23_009400 [Marinomonas agarivorans]